MLACNEIEASENDIKSGETILNTSTTEVQSTSHTTYPDIEEQIVVSVAITFIQHYTSLVYMRDIETKIC